jgi:type I restriction enzyme R subunit
MGTRDITYGTSGGHDTILHRESGAFSSKQQEFVNFVLAHYVGVGVGELDQEKLTPLLRLRYRNSIADAIADLGRPEEISKVFVGFQKYLYQPTG